MFPYGPYSTLSGVPSKGLHSILEYLRGTPIFGNPQSGDGEGLGSRDRKVSGLGVWVQGSGFRV